MEEGNAFINFMADEENRIEDFIEDKEEYKVLHEALTQLTQKQL